MELFQTRLDCLSFSLESRLLQQGKHILLVGFYPRLIEGIYFEHIATNPYCLLKEVEELTDVVSIELGKYDANVGNASIDVGDAHSEFGHLIDFVDTLAS